MNPDGECIDIDGWVIHHPLCSYLYAYVGDYLRLVYGNDIDWVIHN